MDTPISRAEHEEFRRRMEERNKQQDKRFEKLEGVLDEVHSLATSIERLTSRMEAMVKEQERQGERLEALEGRDGEMWRKVVGYVLTAVISVTVGFIFSKIGF